MPRCHLYTGQVLKGVQKSKARLSGSAKSKQGCDEQGAKAAEAGVAVLQADVNLTQKRHGMSEEMVIVSCQST